ncbi:CsbD family protein [Catenulispora subtropica]|uniref:CsbD-like domain-containing protein n=1 Tax=Catenulispora subtropica TaxID=450798 RepID=A0ABN2T8T6_9ACTN
MGVGNKTKYAAQDAKGKVKEAAGKVSGNDRLRAEGRGDQVEAHAKHAADKAKDTAKNVGKEAKGKAKEVAGAVTGKQGMEAKGKAEQVAAHAKQKANK